MDVNPPPACLLIESPALDLGLEDVSIDRYYSKAWHDREVEKVWRKTWQMACRVEEIPNVGDHVVYDIVHDSVIVTRVSETEIRGYINSCLHRGTRLRMEDGNARHFKCPVQPGCTIEVLPVPARHFGQFQPLCPPDFLQVFSRLRRQVLVDRHQVISLPPRFWEPRR